MMSTVHRSRFMTTGAILGVLGAGYSAAAPAQAPAAANSRGAERNAASVTPVEEVVVSGTRLIVNGYEAPTPVTILTAEDLESSAPSNIPDALNKLPQFANSRSNSQSIVGTPSVPLHGNYLNLRGVGFHRVLTLLDGQRLAPTSFEGGVDSNTLPQMLIERVDVVTAGASAAYGSDALSGAVNYILDKDFTGVKAILSGGLRSDDEYDDSSYRYGIALGESFFDGRLHLEGSFEQYSRDGIPNKFVDSEIVRRMPLALGGGTPTTVFRTAYDTRLLTQSFGGVIRGGPLAGQQFLPGGVLAPFDPGTPTSNSGISSGGDGAFHNQVSGTIQLDTQQAFGRASFDITPNIEAFAYVSHAEADSFFFGATPAANVTIFSENAFLTDAQRALLGATPSFTLGRRFNETNGLQIPSTTRSTTAAVGLDGQFGEGWSWSVGYAHSEAKLHIAQRNQIQVQFFAAAVDAVRDPSGNIVCRVTLTNPGLYPGCVPINIFGAGSITPEAMAYSFRQSSAQVINKMEDVSASIAGSPFSLWAGPVNVAVGMEYREESLDQTSTADPALPVDFTGLRAPVAPRLFNTGQVGVAAGSADVKEAFTELAIPLLQDQPFAQSLELNGALRYTDYSTSGDVTTWKAGLSYVPLSGLRFRGTASRDIRAPTLYELFAGEQFSRTLITDRHTGVTDELVQISGGNPDVQPEIGETTTFGVVLQPEFLPGFSASIDYWRLEITDGIGVPGTVANINEECTLSGGTSPICASVVRPLPFSDTSPANFPTFVRVQNINIANEYQRGIDFELSQRIDMSSMGTLDLRLLGSYVPTRRAKVTPSQPELSFAGAIHGPSTTNPAFTFPAYPKLPMTLQIDYNVGPLNIFVQERYISKLDRNWNPTQVFEAHEYDPVYYTDLSVAYKLSGLDGPLSGITKGGEIFLHVSNLFDKQPPFVPDLTVSPGLWYPTSMSVYDIVGRYFTAGLRFGF